LDGRVRFHIELGAFGLLFLLSAFVADDFRDSALRLKIEEFEKELREYPQKESSKATITVAETTIDQVKLDPMMERLEKWKRDK